MVSSVLESLFQGLRRHEMDLRRNHGRVWTLLGIAGLSVGCGVSQSDLYSADGAGANITSQPDLRCQADAAPALSSDYSRPGPYAVGKVEVTFEDRSRPVVANDKHAGAPFRSLPTNIFYPTSSASSLLFAANAASGGPFPMLMYSHGFGSSRGEADTIAKRAASYGYIVVAPEFPFSNTNVILTGESDTSDIANQVGDQSFLIDQLLSLSNDPTHVLHNAVDATRIGATGVSMGGLTTLLITFHPKMFDERIKAAVPITALSSFFMQEYFHTREVPLLFIHGDLDAFIPYQPYARRAFERAAPNARLVTIAKGTHAAFAFQLDRSTLELMNGLLAAPGSSPGNVDAFGCGVIGTTLQKERGFLQPLGGKENFIDYDETKDPILPCTGDQTKQPSMDATEQVELAARAVVSFFDAQLAAKPAVRQNGCGYLLHELPKHPAVRVE